MAEKIFRRLTSEDLHMLADTKKDARALEIWEIDEKSAELFLADPRNYFFACIEEGKIIGYVCGYELCRLDSSGHMLYIHGVGVHADYRRQGIGRGMMAAVLQTCRLQGMGKAFLYAHKENNAACALYEASGGTASRSDKVSYYFYCAPL